jgi:hypothetical protein
MRTFVQAVAVLAAASAALGGKLSPHPHFDDGGTLHWHTKLADAKAAAKRDGRLVLIEYGREA